jgi:hypothetical protein
MNFQRKRKKTIFFNNIFNVSPYIFTQIASVGTRWMEIKFHIQ